MRRHLNEVRESVRQRSAEELVSSRDDRKCKGPETYQNGKKARVIKVKQAKGQWLETKLKR